MTIGKVYHNTEALGDFVRMKSVGDQGDGSVDMVFATRACGPKFESPELI